MKDASHSHDFEQMKAVLERDGPGELLTWLTGFGGSAGALIARGLCVDVARLVENPSSLGVLLYNALRAQGVECNVISEHLPGLESPVRLQRALASAEHRIYRGAAKHAVPILASDQQRVITVASDRIVRVWDAAIGLSQRAFANRSLVALATSPVSAHILVSDAGTLSEYDLHTEMEISRSPLLFNFETDSIAYSSAGRRFAVGGSGGLMHEWRLDSGESLPAYEFPFRSVNVHTYNSSGTKLLVSSSGMDGEEELWELDVATRELIYRHEPAHFVCRCAYSPDDQRFLVATSHGDVIERESCSGVELHRFPRQKSSRWLGSARITDCVYSLDGSRALACSDAGHLIEFDFRSGGLLQCYQQSGSGLLACAYSADGARVLAAGTDGAVRGWVREEERRVYGRARSCAFRYDGQRLAVLGDELQQFDVASGCELSSDTARGAQTCSYDQDGALLLGLCGGAVLELDADSGASRRAYGPERSALGGLFAYSSDGKLIVVGAGNESIEVLERASGAPLVQICAAINAVASCAFSPSSDRILTACLSGALREWNAQTGAMLANVKLPFTARVCMYHPGGKRVLAGGSNGCMCEWDLTTGKLSPVRQLHSSMITGCAYLLDGAYFASASADGTIKLWQQLDGSPVHTIYGRTGFMSLAVHERMIAAVDDAGQLWLFEWDAPPVPQSGGADPVDPS